MSQLPFGGTTSSGPKQPCCWSHCACWQRGSPKESGFQRHKGHAAGGGAGQELAALGVVPKEQDQTQDGGPAGGGAGQDLAALGVVRTERDRLGAGWGMLHGLAEPAVFSCG